MIQVIQTNHCPMPMTKGDRLMAKAVAKMVAKQALEAPKPEEWDQDALNIDIEEATPEVVAIPEKVVEPEPKAIKAPKKTPIKLFRSEAPKVFTKKIEKKKKVVGKKTSDVWSIADIIW